MELTITRPADITRGIGILRAAAVALVAFLGDPLAAPPAIAQTTCRVDLQITSPLTYVNTPFDPELDFAALIEQAGIQGVVDYDSIRVIDPTTGAVVAHALGIGFQDRDRGRVEWVVADPHQTAFEIHFQVVAERPPRRLHPTNRYRRSPPLQRRRAATPRPHLPQPTRRLKR
jgi:hypothetical protein